MVSVIIPTFNRASTLLRALDSVATQTYQDWELLIVDDGSTDNSVELVRRWIADKGLSTRAQVLALSRNGGVSYARNRGAETARGDWLAFLDSDDEWLPDRLKLQIPLTSSYPLIHGEEIWVRHGVRVNPMQKHKKSGGHIFTRCVDLCCISPSATLIRAELFRDLSGFREDFPVCEDYELWLRVASRYQIGFIEEPILIKYGGHEDQLSHRYKAMDFFRVKALLPYLNSNLISHVERTYVAANILKRGHILLNGYQKHNRLEQIPQVEEWLELARRALTVSQIAHSAADLRPRSDNSFVL